MGRYEVTLKLSITELEQLRWYVKDDIRDYYYGNKKHFDKRHERIVSELNLCIEAIQDKTP
jgi:hypothetical protein